MNIRLNKKRLTDIAFIIPSFLSRGQHFCADPLYRCIETFLYQCSGNTVCFLSNYITIFQNSAF